MDFNTQRLLHPCRLTWNIIMEVGKMIFLSKWVIYRFHVNLPGCILNGFRKPGNHRKTPESDWKGNPSIELEKKNLERKKTRWYYHQIGFLFPEVRFKLHFIWGWTNPSGTHGNFVGPGVQFFWWIEIHIPDDSPTSSRLLTAMALRMLTQMRI